MSATTIRQPEELRARVESVAAAIEGRTVAIFEALALLTQHPLIGRPVDRTRHELVIGRDRRGCVALYRYDALDDEVVVLALRAQRELGFDQDG